MYPNKNKVQITYSNQLQCSNCKVKKNPNTGSYLKYNNGLNQRWVCFVCQDKHANKSCVIV